ncbi:superinfection immunity protein [Paraburkholderia sp. EG285A]|uniref:superinfection immunity protein n=1 Tax=Paraburkholderia sp. EG285A TaxID=3237009 RepID=UPI0034D34FB8
MFDYQSSTGAVDTRSDSGGLLVMLVCLYFVPSILAFHRMHHRRHAITRLNSLLGWSVLGWIVAFVWALAAVQKGELRDEQARTCNCENRLRSENGFSLIE